jgi:DNA processing protein
MVFHRAPWLAWPQIPGIGPILLKRIYDHFGCLTLAWEATEKELLAVEGLGERLAQNILSHRPTIDLEECLAATCDRNPQFITPADPEYPASLWSIPDPPGVLYYQGNLSYLDNPCIAIVGTRHSTDYGKRWTRRLSAKLAQEGFVIVSGLAAGIDAEAHQTCLELKAPTIAVLGTGIDIPYPHKNKSIHQQIAQSHLLLSEYPAGTGPDRAHFPRRNRIVAGLAQATLVTEAGEGSGALITAHLAQKFGRSLHVLAGSLDNPNAKGCLQLIHEGAQIILGETELLTTLPKPEKSNVTATVVAPTIQTSLFTNVDLRPELDRLLKTLSAEPLNLDRILELTNLPIATVSSGLIELELLGLISQTPGMSYAIV